MGHNDNDSNYNSDWDTLMYIYDDNKNDWDVLMYINQLAVRKQFKTFCNTLCRGGGGGGC